VVLQDRGLKISHHPLQSLMTKPHQ
jgi:hypothetical protein